MKFKSWKDFYLFVREFAKYSCLNCKYGSSKKLEFESDNDIGYCNHFCAYWVAMVRWDLQPFVCKHWESNDGVELPEDDELLTLSEHILKKLEKGNRKWSIDDVKELL